MVSSLAGGVGSRTGWWFTPMSTLTPANHTRRWRRRNERGGGQWAIPTLLLIPAFMLLVGLVVDGGRYSTATREAQAVAAAAARAGVDAAASSQIAGARIDTTAAVSTARSYLTSTSGVSGSVQLLGGGQLQVTTSQTRPTLYLGLAGINTVTGRGSATVGLYGPGEGG